MYVNVYLLFFISLYQFKNNFFQDKSAKSITKILTEDVIRTHGPFQILKSNRGREFNKLINKRNMSVTQYRTKALHPIRQRNFKYSRKKPAHTFWFLQQKMNEIIHYTFAYNTIPHLETRYVLFKVMYARVPSNEKILNWPTYNLYDYTNEFKTKLKYSVIKAKRKEKKAKNSERKI